MKDFDAIIGQIDYMLKSLPSHAASINIIGGNGVVSNGSTSLVCIKGRKFVITNKHVVDHCMTTVSRDPNAVIAIGGIQFQFDSGLIIDISEKLDLATLELPEHVLRSLEGNGHKFWSTNVWPLPNVEAGMLAMAVGFPGNLREQSGREITNYIGSFYDEVESVSDRRFLIRFDRSAWIQRLGDKSVDDLSHFGGMSGGPVFF